MTDLIVYANGVLDCNVCAPASLPRAQIESEVNREYPAGSRWRISGAGNPPVPCATYKDRLHYRLVC